MAVTPRGVSEANCPSETPWLYPRQHRDSGCAASVGLARRCRRAEARHLRRCDVWEPDCD
ncbi:hypothetical protein ACFPRL_36200 [Pseudoclavibacter helvolus]